MDHKIIHADCREAMADTEKESMDNDEGACNIAEKRLQWAQSESIKESAKPTQTRLLDD